MNVLTVPLNTISYKFDRNIINTLFFESTYGSVNTMFDEIESQLKNFQSLKDINSLRKKMQIILLVLVISLMVTWICVMATSVNSTKSPNIGLMMGISFGGFFSIVIFAIISQCFVKKKIDEIQIYYSDTINLILKGYNSDIFNRVGIHSILQMMLMVVQRRSNAHQTIFLNITFSKNGGGNINFIPGTIPQNNYFPNNFGAQQGLEFNQGLPNQGFSNNQNNYGIQNGYQGNF